MLSVFPELLTYQLLAPFIVRVVLGFLFLNLGYLKLQNERKTWTVSLQTLGIRPATFWVPLLGIVQIIGGVLLIVGAFTQPTALVFAVIAGVELFVEFRQQEILKRGVGFYLLLVAASLSLIFSGAGFLAIDLPL